MSFKIFKVVDLISQTLFFKPRNKAFLLFQLTGVFEWKGTEPCCGSALQKGSALAKSLVIWHRPNRQDPSPAEGLLEAPAGLRDHLSLTGTPAPLPDPRRPSQHHRAVPEAGLPSAAHLSLRRLWRCGAPCPAGHGSTSRAVPCRSGAGETAEAVWGWCRCRRRALGCSLMVCGGGGRPQARSLPARYGDGGGGGSRPGEAARSDPAQFLHLQPQAGAQRGRGTGGGDAAARGCGARRARGPSGAVPAPGRLSGLGCPSPRLWGPRGYRFPWLLRPPSSGRVLLQAKQWPRCCQR